MAEQNPGKPESDGRAAGAENSNNLPLLNSLGQGRPARQSSGGMVAVLIAGSTALVVVLIALTIVFGRTPIDQPEAAANTDTHMVAPATTYASPEPTGPRWTAEPIITGVPQKEAPPETPSASPTPSKSEEAEQTPSPQPEPQHEDSPRPDDSPTPADAEANSEDD